MASSIGIKIANGEFYPLVEENSLIKKRLVLTTVHDNQPSVQIDLFRSPINDMSEAQYIGTVVVDNIKPKTKGEPSIEMVISSDENGNIIADAIDLDSGANGEHYVLTVSLKSMDEVSRDIDIPDFELESSEEPPSGLYQHASKIRENEGKARLRKWIIIILIIFLLLGLLSAWLFLFGGLNTVRSIFDKPDASVMQVTVQTPEPAVPEPAPQQAEPVPPPEPVRQPEPAPQQTEPAPPPEPVRQPEPAPEPVIAAVPAPAPEPVQQVVTPPPVIQAPVIPPVSAAPRAASGRNAPVASYNVPAVIPREGVNYTIRWGDTLWDISEAFYRDPWQYPRIARFNGIPNPNLIISGRTVRIPPRN